MYCTKCGAFVPPDTLFCTKCGESMSAGQNNNPGQAASQNSNTNQYNNTQTQNNGQGNQWQGTAQQPNNQAGTNGWNGANPYQNSNPNPNQFNGNQGQQNTGWNRPNPGNFQYNNQANSNIIVALGYIPILFWLPLVMEKNSAIGRKIANQGLLLLIISAVVQVVRWIFHGMFYFSNWGGIFSMTFGLVNGVLQLIFGAVGIAVFVFMIIGFLKAIKGEVYELPLIGKIHIIV